MHKRFSRSKEDENACVGGLDCGGGGALLCLRDSWFEAVLQYVRLSWVHVVHVVPPSKISFSFFSNHQIRFFFS